MKFFEFETVGSTNTVAARHFKNGECGPFWVQANVQTGGRGRRGRDWISTVGNFYGSALYPFAGTPPEAAKVSFVAAIAVHDTLSVYGVSADLKWPNDVLVDGAKICGILLENLGGALVVGIGINLTHHPDIAGRQLTHLLAHIPHDLIETSEPIFTDARGVLPILAARFDHWMRTYLSDGFAPIRTAWLARARGIPGPVRVSLSQRQFSGQAIDFGPDGALHVSLSDGTI